MKICTLHTPFLTRKLATSALSAAMMLGSAAGAYAQDCSNTCEPVPYDTPSGTPPAGTQLIVTANPPTPGSGNPQCTWTCTPCRQTVTISFYGNGTGNCITVSHSGGAWSTADDFFSRPGRLTAMCNEADTFTIRIGSCAGLPDTYVYSEWIDLFCEC